MAPLLGRKPFPLVKPLPGEEPLFTIAHTQETFRTREYPFLAAPAWPPAGWGRLGRGFAVVESHAALRQWQLSACPATAGLYPEPEPAVLELGCRRGCGLAPFRAFPSPVPSILSSSPHLFPGLSVERPSTPTTTPGFGFRP